mmetsp:Transcript_46404/g.149608  ORF Transcript_46404/g.149608 Transcript_46404/m.149608 type:complete len:361 (+) Transcript_46404:697-1779(+)
MGRGAAHPARPAARRRRRGEARGGRARAGARVGVLRHGGNHPPRKPQAQLRISGPDPRTDHRATPAKRRRGGGGGGLPGAGDVDLSCPHHPADQLGRRPRPEPALADGAPRFHAAAALCRRGGGGGAGVARPIRPDAKPAFRGAVVRVDVSCAVLHLGRAQGKDVSLRLSRLSPRALGRRRGSAPSLGVARRLAVDGRRHPAVRTAEWVADMAGGLAALLRRRRLLSAQVGGQRAEVGATRRVGGRRAVAQPSRPAAADAAGGAGGGRRRRGRRRQDVAFRGRLPGGGGVEGGEDEAGGYAGRGAASGAVARESRRRCAASEHRSGARRGARSGSLAGVALAIRGVNSVVVPDASAAAAA